MAYCSNCGGEISVDALFCPKCGTKTARGIETNAVSSSDELKDAFSKMSKELERVFSVAAKEINAAFQKASENIQKSVKREKISCKNCGESNLNNSIFCFNCGKKLNSE